MVEVGLREGRSCLLEVRLAVAKHLTDEQYRMFLETYTRHVSTMNSRNREVYKLSNVERVEWSESIGCLKVYFANGEWWHYTPEHTWY